MAETSNNAKTTGATRKSTARKTTGTRRSSAASRSTAGRSTGTNRSTASRSTAAAKSPSRSTARWTRTTAARETRDAAQANARAATVTAKQGRNVAERAALVYVGATLTMRDRAVALVEDLRTQMEDLRTVTTREGAEKRIAGYERRGTQARTQLERDVRKARTRVERQLTTRRRDAERFVRRAERTAERRPNVVADQITRVETVVQAGVAAGERLAVTAKERVAARA